MGQFIDLTGKKFNRWTVIKRAGVDKNQNILWLCKCDCGTIREVLGCSLRNATTMSCGCYQKEMIHKIHGQTHTRLYKIWDNMKSRCFNNKHDSYYKYGARGITICDKWRNDFKAFYDWSMANGYDDKLTIDRIDNNGNYCPENCRWTTVKIQSRNTRTNHYISHNGKTLCLAEWAEKLNMRWNTLYYKLKRNDWRLDKCMKT
ncbi:MAG: hypothetical protein J6R99_00880 [Alphaproteobacteria bacterium]|nr:hypothetical protein [Alphaproteobacteria bacterium]